MSWIRLLVVCPAALVPAANQLAACAGVSIADAETFGVPSYRDEAGNLYSVCAASVTPRVLGALSDPASIQRPEYDTEAVINLDAARGCLLAVEPEGLDLNVVSVFVADDALGALAKLGLTQVPEPAQ